MKRKYLDGSHWTWLKDYTYNYKHIAGECPGYIAFIQVKAVKEQLRVVYGGKEFILCDDGYSGIIFLPDHTHWCASAVFDDKKQVVEWYFDMTKQHGIDERGIPYFDDLYLDLVVAPDFSVRILDEDELKEALEIGHITQADFDLAYGTCRHLQETVITHRTFMIDFFEEQLAEMPKSEHI